LKKFHFYLRNIRSWLENVCNRFWSFGIRNSTDAARHHCAYRFGFTINFFYILNRSW